ncbi:MULTISPECIES: copper homeostasis protein CutC [unclassified Pseudoxanthomonas]|uniref:copper homeostasis protein CutC n=1 Tax=unclassified Pseudoxanthomonas TaxID=2645906 RepID=UPI0030784F33
MSTPYVLEIAANSLASALAAQEGGASRIELCSALELGGLTPSPGQVALVRDKLSIPVYVLIRPRAGDFAYAEEEHATMLADIAHCAAAGCDGVVVGALTADGDVDVTRCRELVSAANGIDVTFHRAIDVCRDPAAALEAIIGLGCARVLSSGGAASAMEGSANLRRLIEHAAGRIEIMPGAGIGAGNIAALMAATGAREFHASAKRALPPRMRFMPADALGMAGGETRSDAAEVRRIVEALREAAAKA